MSLSLTERIWSAVPAGQPAFLRLLDLLAVVESREVASAAVTLGTRSRLLVNPDFAERHCATDARLAMLVMHELFHVLLGHTRLAEGVTLAHNIAFDAVINAHLCLLFPTWERTTLFRSLYRADRFPEALLRPPDAWRTSGERWLMEGEAKRVHRALYSEGSVTYAELFDLIAPLAEKAGAGAFDPGRLLGSHAQSGRESADPDFARAVREIIAEWPMDPRCPARGPGAEASDGRVQPARRRADFVAALRRALLSVVDLGPDARGPVRSIVAPVETTLAYRTRLDRRGAVRAAVGLPVLLHQAEVDQHAPARAERVHVYLDVSGSMARLLPLIYMAMHPFVAYLHRRVHLFSTKVFDVTPQDLVRGRVRSTGGTDIRCVTAHLLAHPIKRALVITDGFVGSVPAPDLRRIKQRRVRLATAISDVGKTSFAKALAARIFRLPPVSSL